MVTREWLLEKGFSFRVWDGSKSPNGEYSIIGTIILAIIFIGLLYETNISIRKHDDTMAKLCSLASGFVGLYLGLLLGQLLT